MASRHEFVLENGNKFYIRRYDAFLSMRILGEVQKKFLAPLAMFIESNSDTATQESKDKSLQEALNKLSTSLDGESLVELTKKVLNSEYISVSIDNEPASKLDEGLLNMATDGIYDVVALLFEVLRFNYADLFTRGRNLIGQVQLSPTEAIH